MEKDVNANWFGMTPFAVLFVCMGNICRSPTAHDVCKRKLMDAGLANQVQVDSAGTHNYHPGSPPDARSQVYAEKRGSPHECRLQFEIER